MEIEKLDKNINLLSWLLGLMVFLILAALNYFEAEVKQNPTYGLLISLFLIGIFQFINYQLVGKYRVSLGVTNEYMFYKLASHPGIWVGVAAGGLLYAFSS